MLTTILLALEDSELTQACIERVRQGTARIDEKLILELYRACDRKNKLALARSSLLGWLTPPTFKKIFDEVHGRSDLTAMERNGVLWNLEGYLFLHPRQIRRYEHLILELLKSPQVDLRARAGSMVGLLNRLDDPALTSFARGLRSRSPPIRSNTLNGLWQMIERFDRLDHHLRDFLSSDAFRAQVSRMRRSDPDDAVRHNARSVLRALGRRRS